MYLRMTVAELTRRVELVSMPERKTIEESRGSSLEDPVQRRHETRPLTQPSRIARSPRADAAAVTGKARLTLLLVMIAVGGWCLSTLRSGHSWGDDFSQYIQHAKNIVEGVDYKQTGYIHNPQYVLGPATYPPVFPFLLAPVYWWFGLNLVAMKVEIVLIFLLSLFVIYLTFKDELSWLYLIALVATIGFNPYLWQFKEDILSDLPLLLFVYLSLFFIWRAPGTKPTGKLQRLNALLIGLSIYLAYGTRSIGLVLIPCLLAHDLIKNRRLTAPAIKSVCLAGTFILLQNLFSHSDGVYANQIGVQPEFLSVVWRNTLTYAHSLFGFWANGYSRLFQSVLVILLTGSSVIGYCARLKEKVTCFEIFPALYLGPFILMPLKADARYLIPVIPLYLFYAFLGLQMVAHRWKIEGIAFVTVIAVILATYVARYTKLSYGSPPDGIGKSETQQLFEYVKKETGEQDIFIFRKPRAFALFTARPASIWSGGQDDQKQWGYFRQIKATYLVLSRQDCLPPDQLYFCGFIARHRDRLQETYSNADFHVYRIKSTP